MALGISWIGCTFWYTQFGEILYGVLLHKNLISRRYVSFGRQIMIKAGKIIMYQPTLMIQYITIRYN